MPALPDNLHRGRYLLLLVGLFVVLFVAGMMTLGALGAAGATLFWGRAGVTVVHCLMQRRKDGRGSNTNARLFAAAKSFGADLTPGTPGASVLPEFGPAPEDLVLTRTHGVGPMTGTDLDPVLRNLGIRTIVGVGVSVNIAIPNFVMDAVNRGYHFVLPRDAVAGYPRDYADAVIDNSLALLATVTTSAQVVDIWRRSATSN